MINPDLKARALRAAQTCRTHGITQADIAIAVGASQPQVSRILKAQGLRASRLFEEVCLYVERFEGGVTAEAVQTNEELIGALKLIWDGSAAHAHALSTVIRSLAVLSPPQNLISPSRAKDDQC
jgi:transcriptional regulator with XRE-family HTH domain